MCIGSHGFVATGYGDRTLALSDEQRGNLGSVLRGMGPGGMYSLESPARNLRITQPLLRAGTVKGEDTPGPSV